MDPEEKKEDGPEGFGKVIDALHSKKKLSSLRTYQGDMAEFIKNKDESVISVALKEKERKERQEKEPQKPAFGEIPKVSPTPKSKSNKEFFQINLTIVLLSLFLIGAGLAVYFYVFKSIKKEPVVQIVVKEDIIPYNNLITLKDIVKTNFESKFKEIVPANGINIVKINAGSGLVLEKSKDFFNFLGIPLPANLERTLGDKYAIGFFSQNDQTANFLIITINDFGQAFSGMLDWEPDLPKDLAFLNSQVGTSTEKMLSWKDLIVKNKDTRALVGERGQAKIAYTFLDKNTILIINDLSFITDLASAYASHSVAR